MKAVDYARQYEELIQSPESLLISDELERSITCSVKIAIRLDNEMAELIRSRRVKTDSSFLAVLREFKDKWFAACKKVSPVVPPPYPKAFLKVLEKRHPSAYQLLVSGK
jgi:hypothetical protein